MKSKKILYTSFLALLAPVAVFAQTYDQDIFGLGQYILDLIQNLFLYLIFAFAVIFFLYNILQYIRNPGDIKKSKEYILWGLVALTVMFTFYAIIRLLAATFNFTVGIPQFFGGNAGAQTGTTYIR